MAVTFISFIFGATLLLLAPSSANAQVPVALSRFDSLFIVAATGEPRFEAARDSCRQALIRENEGALAYLLKHRLTEQTARQKHYVRELFTVLSDSGGNPAPRRHLEKALPQVSDSLKAQLLYIGSRLGDTAFAAVARAYLHASDEEVRRNATRSLGAYPRAEHIPLLLAGIEKTRERELHQRLWALAQQEKVPDWQRLVFALSDSSLANRQSARQIIARSAPGWPEVEKALTGHQVAILEEMLLAAELRDERAANFWMRSYAKLDPLSRRFVPAAYPGRR